MYDIFRKLVEGSLSIRRANRLAKSGSKKPRYIKHKYYNQVEKSLEKRNKVRKLDTHFKWDEIILKNKSHKSDRAIRALQHFKYNGRANTLPFPRMSYKDKRRYKKNAAYGEYVAPIKIKAKIIDPKFHIHKKYKNQTDFENSIKTNVMKTIKNVKSKYKPAKHFNTEKPFKPLAGPKIPKMKDKFFRKSEE